jgi:nucleotide-binding universal stress UspA family protein
MPMNQNHLFDSDTSPPIIVGVDGSDTALAAVRWAADEAVSRRVPLTLICAAPGSKPHVLDAASIVVSGEQGHALAVLSVAQAEAVSRAHALRVNTRVAPETAVAALVAASEHAALLVLGLTGTGGLDEVLLGSTTLPVCDRARCPVVGVRNWPVSGSPDGPVVVGVSSATDDAVAVEVAFERARRRHRPVRVVHAAHLPGLTSSARDRARARQRAELVAALAPWRNRYPDIQVGVEVRGGSPAEALLAGASDVDAIVTGTRRRSGAARALLGSTSRSVLRHSPVPVIVANPDLALTPALSWPFEQSELDPHARSQLW